MTFIEALQKISYDGAGIEERNGNYRAYIYDKYEKVNIGTYNRYSDAVESIFNVRCQRFQDSVLRYESNPAEGVLIFNKYVIYPSGNLFNLKGYLLKKTKDQYGHDTIKLNGKSYYFKTIYENVNWDE